MVSAQLRIMTEMFVLIQNLPYLISDAFPLDASVISGILEVHPSIFQWLNAFKKNNLPDFKFYHNKFNKKNPNLV